MRKKSQAGATIIEVLIGAVVLGVLLAGVGSYMYTSTRTQQVTQLSLDLNSVTETLGKRLVDTKPTTGAQGWVFVSTAGIRVNDEKGVLPGERRYEFIFSVRQKSDSDFNTLYLTMWDRSDRSMTNYAVFSFTR